MELEMQSCFLLNETAVKAICSNKDSRKQKGYKIVSLALGITDPII